MAFSTSELQRIKAELGYNILQVGADPYIGVHQIFEVVIQTYIADAVETTSSTTVTAASAATPVTLALASATGFATGQRVYVDVDDRVETATSQSLSGSNATVLLQKAHTGTYPVIVEGPIAIAREYLRNIAAVKSELSSTFGYGALKRVDEIEFHPNQNATLFDNLGSQVQYWRNELASLLGVPNMWKARRDSGSRLSVY